MSKQKGAAALIAKMSRETLEAILLERVKEDPILERRIRSRYGASTEIGHYRSLVEGMLEGLRGWGYDGYEEGDAYSAAAEIDDLFAQADKKPANERARAVYSLAQAVIEEVTPSLDSADDHDGNLYGAVDDAFERVVDIARTKNADPVLLAQILSWAEGILSSDRLGSWGREWTERCLLIAANTARTEDKLREVLAICDKLLDKEEKDGSRKYLAGKIAVLKTDIYGRLGTGDERADFIETHLDLDDIRRLAIADSFEAKDFTRCKALSTGGIAQAEAEKSPGLVDRYRILLVEAMDSIGEGRDADVLVERWTIEDNDDGWFKALKKRKSKAAWIETRERVFTALERARNRTWLIASLYSSENLLDRLMSLCEQDPREFQKYYPRLMGKYPSRVAPLLLALIRRKASADSQRGSYKETAALVADYAKCAGAAACASLIDDLEKEYKARRAMREELEKVRPKGDYR